MHASAAFLDTVLAGLGLTLNNCGPMDMLIFLSEHYIPQHVGSQLPNGSVQMAPGSVANCISALNKGFQQLSRTGPWAHGQGNPTQAPEVRDWQRGHTRISTADGFKITGAQVISPHTAALCLKLAESLPAQCIELMAGKPTIAIAVHCSFQLLTVCCRSSYRVKWIRCCCSCGRSATHP